MKPKVVARGAVEQVRMMGDDGFGLVMRAEDIRDSRTGLHATLKLMGVKPDSAPRFLAGTTCNVTRDEERTKLLNTARRQSGEYEERMFGGPEYKALLKRDYDIFCFSISDTLMAVEAPKLVRGEMLGPIDFLAKPLVLKKGGTILFGPGGSGKSYTGFLSAIAVDSGTNGIWGTVATRSLLVNLERPEDTIVRRIFATNSALGLESDRPLAVMTARGKTLTGIEPVVRRYIQDEGIGFVVLDSISRAGMGKLTDDDTANATVDILNSFGVAWLAIGHTSKDNPNEVFGSVHYANGADIVAKLSSERRGPLELGVRIEVTKANDIIFPEPMTLRYTFDEEYGLHTAKIVGPDTYPELSKDTRTLPQKITDYLLEEAGQASATEIAGVFKVTPSGVSRILNTDERFVSLGRQGKEVIYAVKHNV
jgi:hypothetical protein